MSHNPSPTFAQQEEQDRQNPRSLHNHDLIKIELTIKSTHHDREELGFAKHVTITKMVPAQIHKHRPHGVVNQLARELIRTLKANFWNLNQLATVAGFDVPAALEKLILDIGIKFEGQRRMATFRSGTPTLKDEELNLALAWYEKSGWKDCIGVIVEMKLTENMKTEIKKLHEENAEEKRGRAEQRDESGRGDARGRPENQEQRGSSSQNSDGKKSGRRGTGLFSSILG